VVVGGAPPVPRLHDGVLADVAPTIVELAGLERWDGMTGQTLFDPVVGHAAIASSPPSAGRSSEA
jgi:hypothetical protein